MPINEIVINKSSKRPGRNSFMNVNNNKCSIKHYAHTSNQVTNINLGGCGYTSHDYHMTLVFLCGNLRSGVMNWGQFVTSHNVRVAVTQISCDFLTRLQLTMLRSHVNKFNRTDLYCVRRHNYVTNWGGGGVGLQPST